MVTNTHFVPICCTMYIHNIIRQALHIISSSPYNPCTEYDFLHFCPHYKSYHIWPDITSSFQVLSSTKPFGTLSIIFKGQIVCCAVRRWWVHHLHARPSFLWLPLCVRICTMQHNELKSGKKSILALFASKAEINVFGIFFHSAPSSFGDTPFEKKLNTLIWAFKAYSAAMHVP